MAVVERLWRLARGFKRRSGVGAGASCSHEMTNARFTVVYFGCKGHRKNLYSYTEGVICRKCHAIFDRDMPP